MADKELAAQLNAQLRQAHIRTLRERYEALIAQQQTQHEREEAQYGQDTQRAYVDKKEKQRDLPQQLAALGLGGGMADTLSQQVQADYEQTMEQLRRDRRIKQEDYALAVGRQRAALNNALNEYVLRNAVSAANSAPAKTTKSAGSSRAGSGKQPGTAQTTGVPEPVKELDLWGTAGKTSANTHSVSLPDFSQF